MHQDLLIRFDGSIIEVLPEARYRVRFSNGQEAIAHASDSIGRSDVADLSAELITVELSPQDLSTGRLIFYNRATISDHIQLDHNLAEELSS